MRSVKTFLKSYSKRSASEKVITTFLALILTLRNFIFNCKNYLKIKSCSMGAICAPSYANIFMDHFDRKFIYLLIKTFSLIYLSFIDDIIFILNTHQLNLNMKYRKKECHFWIPKYILKAIRKS